jgi:hypothetical protein
VRPVSLEQADGAAEQLDETILVLLSVRDTDRLPSFHEGSLDQLIADRRVLCPLLELVLDPAERCENGVIEPAQMNELRADVGDLGTQYRQEDFQLADPSRSSGYRLARWALNGHGAVEYGHGFLAEREPVFGEAFTLSRLGVLQERFRPLDVAVGPKAPAIDGELPQPRPLLLPVDTHLELGRRSTKTRSRDSVARALPNFATSSESCAGARCSGSLSGSLAPAVVSDSGRAGPSGNST